MSYDHGFGLLKQQKQESGNTYYTFDAIGNTQEMTNSAQQKVNRYVYEPFGKNFINNELIYNPFKFVGQFGVMKETNGLDFMRARYYDLKNGKFVSQDPIGLNSGNTNFYTYAANSPSIYSDPTGLRARTVRTSVTYSVSTSGIYSATYSEGRLQDLDNIAARRDRYWDEGHNLYSDPYYTDFINKLDDPLDWESFGRNFLPTIDLEDGQVIATWNPWNIIIDTISWAFTQLGPGEIKLPHLDPGSILEWLVGLARPIDPNIKTGPRGFGDQNYVSINSIYPYRIDFENDPDATAPAQVVEIRDPLSEALDWTTFELTEIGFGDVMISIPVGSQRFEKKVPFTFNGVDFEIEIEAGINLGTGEVYANFYSVDPWTGLPPAVDVGFLPPEDGTGRGMGYINYNIKAMPDLTTGTELRNIAYITFDFMETIATNQIDPHDPGAGTDPVLECPITIDAGLPESHIDPLPEESVSPFILYITGQDDTGGSGIGGYDIYVSVNDIPFTLWKSTPDDSIEFEGEPGYSYAFYSIAKDNAGNYEGHPQIADTTTTVVQKDLNFNIQVFAQPNEGGTATGGGIYTNGTQVTVNAIANPGWIFVNWTEDGLPVSTSAAYTFTATKDRNLTANFSLVDKYSVTLLAQPEEGGTVTGGGIFDYGTNVTVEATPYMGYTFVTWTEDGQIVSTAEQFTFTVTKDRALTANFDKIDTPDTDWMYVNSIEGTIKAGKVNSQLTATVQVLDKNDVPIQGVVVYAEITSPAEDGGSVSNVSARTNKSGLATFKINSPNDSWRVCVTNLVKRGFDYDSNANTETCDIFSINP